MPNPYTQRNLPLQSAYSQLSVSVVIPTFRRPHLLKRVLESFSRQSYLPPAFEIVVVIDGIDAASADCVSNCNNQRFPIKYFMHFRSRGPAAARNTGWRNAQGALIIFTDDDCIADPLLVIHYMKAFFQNGKPAAFWGRTVVPIGEHPTDYEKNVAKLESSGFITANCACTRDALRITNGFDERYRTAWREDTDLFFSLMQQSVPIYEIREAVITHPARSAGWGVSLAEQKKSRYNALLYKKFPRLFRHYVSRSPVWIYYAIIFCFFGGIIGYIAGLEIFTMLLISFWILLTGWFVYKRLAHTSKAPVHIAEMIVTSVLIPFLSVYWTLNGSIKFKVFFL
ncbi:MAG: glycosyltransferase family 2 protein [Agriterribacter sp.]